MEKQNLIQEPQLLNESEKLRILAEEHYRHEVSNRLKLNNATPLKTKVWFFFNSTLGIWFLSTVVVGLISFLYSTHQETVKKEIETNQNIEIKKNKDTENKLEKTRRNASLVTVLLPYLASNDEKQWRLAMAVTTYLKTKGDLPLELESALVGIVQVSNHSNTSANVNEKVIAAATVIDAKPVAANVNGTSMSNLPPRVYIQIANESQRRIAKSLQTALIKDNFIVPGIEKVEGKAFKLDSSEVRYFRNNDKAEALIIHNSLKSQNLLVRREPKKVTMKNQNRPRHYEIWFSNSK